MPAAVLGARRYLTAPGAPRPCRATSPCPSPPMAERGPADAPCEPDSRGFGTRRLTWVPSPPLGGEGQGEEVARAAFAAPAPLAGDSPRGAKAVQSHLTLSLSPDRRRGDPPGRSFNPQAIARAATVDVGSRASAESGEGARRAAVRQARGRSSGRAARGACRGVAFGRVRRYPRAAPDTPNPAGAFACTACSSAAPRSI